MLGHLAHAGRDVLPALLGRREARHRPAVVTGDGLDRRGAGRGHRHGESCRGSVVAGGDRDRRLDRAAHVGAGGRHRHLVVASELAALSQHDPGEPAHRCRIIAVPDPGRSAMVVDPPPAADQQVVHGGVDGGSLPSVPIAAVLGQHPRSPRGRATRGTPGLVEVRHDLRRFVPASVRASGRCDHEDGSVTDLVAADPAAVRVAVARGCGTRSTGGPCPGRATPRPVRRRRSAGPLPADLPRRAGEPGARAAARRATRREGSRAWSASSPDR